MCNTDVVGAGVSVHNAPEHQFTREQAWPTHDIGEPV